MRIAVVGVRGITREGGIEAYCRYILTRVAALGHEVTVYTRRRYDTQTRYGRLTLRPTRSLGWPRAETLSHAVLAMSEILTMRRADVVQFQAIGPALLAPVARLAGCGVVVRHVGNDWERGKWGPVGRAVLHLAESSAARFADVVICLNEPAAADFRARLKPAAEIRVIANAVSIAPEAPGTELLRRLGLTPGRYVLAVSRLTPEKGLHGLIEAFEASGLAGQGWRLAIAGAADPRRAYVRRLAALAAAGQGTVLAGELGPRELAEIYGHAGIFVNCSEHEGMSFSLLEALSYGIPCIVSDIPSNTIPCQGFAAVVPLNDAPALSQALVRLACAPPDAARREAQRKLMARNHDTDIAARATAAALERSFDLAAMRREIRAGRQVQGDL